MTSPADTGVCASARTTVPSPATVAGDLAARAAKRTVGITVHSNTKLQVDCEKRTVGITVHSNTKLQVD